MHGLSEQPLYGKNEKNPIHVKTKIDYFIMKTFFTRVIVVSHEMRMLLINQYGFKEERVSVIHNGIDISQRTQSSNQSIKQSDDHFFHIGTVGRLTPVKDYSFFLYIAAELRKMRKNISINILVDGH